MSFTTQSESVPLVDATRFATGAPLILSGAVNTVGNEREHIRTPRGLALVVDEPLRPRQPVEVAYWPDSGAHGKGRAWPDPRHIPQMPRCRRPERPN